MVTSPPYFAGKQYEEELGAEGIPASYTEYIALLEGVFAECVAKLEPGGRIAVNVANLGRKPYRSLSADVIGILQDKLGLLLRGEVVWRKARGAGGNCAWGSFRSPANPVLRDLTERVIVASKGRFDRAVAAGDAPARRPARTGPPPRPTSSWRPRSTCGSWRPRAPPASVTRRRSRSSCPSGSSSCTRTRATWCSTRSWGRGPPRWPRCARGATSSATTPTPAYVEAARRAAWPPSASGCWPPGGVPAPVGDKAVDRAAELLARRRVRGRRPHQAQGGRRRRGGGRHRPRRARVAGRRRRRVHDRRAPACGAPTCSSARWGGRPGCPTSGAGRLLVLATDVPPARTPGGKALAAARGRVLVDVLPVDLPASPLDRRRATRCWPACAAYAAGRRRRAGRSAT